MAEANERMAKDISVKPRKILHVNKKKLFYYGLMVIPLLQFCIFYIGVNFQSILLAFQDYDNLNGKFEFISGDLFKNFKDIYVEYTVNNNIIPPAVKNSLILWFCTAICGTLIAIFFSYFIFKCKSIGRFYRFILFLPSILPGVLLANIFECLSRDVLPLLFGWENPLGSSNPSVVLWTAIMYSVFLGFGTQVLLYSNAMEQISPSVLEAAQLDGASPFREFISIILPSIIATIGTFLTTGVASIFTNQNNLLALVGDGAKEFEQTMGYKIYLLCYAYGGKDAYPYAAFLGVLCTLVVVPLALGIRKAVEKVQE
jgi:ABC-type sugar transport system permease subunit